MTGSGTKYLKAQLRHFPQHSHHCADGTSWKPMKLSLVKNIRWWNFKVDSFTSFNFSQKTQKPYLKKISSYFSLRIDWWLDDTEDPLWASGRFITERGTLEKILSDNNSSSTGGRNFLIDKSVPYGNTIQDVLSACQETVGVIEFSMNESIEWIIIPTRAPHFGGLWEDYIKSTQRPIMKMFGVSKLPE